jgi:hypothetical protein
MALTETASSLTGFTNEEMKQFVRNHFAKFVNRKNIDIGDVNFAPEFVDHGSDVPSGTPAGPEGRSNMLEGRSKSSLTCMSALKTSSPKVTRWWCETPGAQRNPGNGVQLQFAGIVIWRIAHRQLVERWAYLEAPHPV